MDPRALQPGRSDRPEWWARRQETGDTNLHMGIAQVPPTGIFKSPSRSAIYYLRTYLNVRLEPEILSARLDVGIVGYLTCRRRDRLSRPLHNKKHGGLKASLCPHCRHDHQPIC
jgi:hypothetical protein